MVKRANRDEVSARVQNRIALLESERAGFTDAEIGRRLSVNRSTVGRWRKGETVPTEAHRRALYRLTRRESFPRDITSQVVRVVVGNGVYHAPPLFIQPVSSGKVPYFYRRKKVYGAYVVVNAWIEFYDDSLNQPWTTTIGQTIPSGASLNDPLIFDGVEAQWRIQLQKMDGSEKIKNYTVTEAYIRLRLPKGMNKIQFEKVMSK